MIGNISLTIRCSYPGEGLKGEMMLRLERRNIMDEDMDMKMFELDMEAFVDAFEDRNFDKSWDDRIREIIANRKQ